MGNSKTCISILGTFPDDLKSHLVLPFLSVAPPFPRLESALIRIVVLKKIVPHSLPSCPFLKFSWPWVLPSAA
jgi:hypothetical protein